MDCSRLIIQQCFNLMNYYRRLHGVCELKYDEKLEVSANKWAKDLSRIRLFCNSFFRGVHYGEAILLKHNSVDNLTGDEIAASWYVEGIGYNYIKQKPKKYADNFTQLIWAASREVGITYVRNTENEVYVVAHFYPPGNIPDNYQYNVFAITSYKIPKCPTLIEMNIIGLIQHNLFRSWHGVKSLVLCHDLIASAQKWAEKIAPYSGQIEYSHDCSISEAIAVIFDPLGYICSKEITHQWYALGKEFDYVNFKLGSLTDLFSQIVWKSTTEIGFGRASYRGYHYLVVHYRPPANKGDFQINVPRLIYPSDIYSTKKHKMTSLV